MVEARNKGPCLGQRHILAVCSGTGLAILFSTRMSLPIALVAMISSNASASHQLESNDSCLTASTNDSGLLGTSVPVHRQFNWDTHTRGLILSSFFWGYLALQVPSGGLAQRYGGKWLTASSIAWLSLLVFLTPTVADFSPYALITLLVLEGVGSSITFPSLFAMFGRWIPPEENSGLITIALSGSYFGTVMGQLLAGVLCKLTFLGGWPMVFYVNGASGVLFVILWSLLIANSPEDHPWITDAEKNYIISSLNSNQSEANKRGVPWCRILCSRGPLVYIMSSFVFGWLSYSFVICFAQYISEVFHQDAAATGGLLCLPVIAEGVMAIIFTQIVDVVRRRRWFSLTVVRKVFSSLGFGGPAICLFGVTLLKCDLIQIESLFILGFAFVGGNYAGFINNPLDICPEYSGTVFAIGNVFTNSAGLIAPIVISYLTCDGSKSSWNNVLYLSSGMGTLAAVLYALLANSDRMQFESDDLTENEEEKSLLGDHDAVSVNYS